jgi:hypothetical protein
MPRNTVRPLGAGATRRPTHITFVAAAAGLVLASAACGDEAGQENHEDFDGAKFSNPTNVDNEWMSLKPGTRWVWEGTTVDDDEVLPHRVVINVTDLTKVIGGVESVVTWDLDYSDGELVEAELAFFAQDDDGNVWRMGEYPEEYEDGEFVVAPAWVHGVEGAVAGISMRADPKVGTPSYSQGWGPGVDFTDRGKVHEFVDEVCVPLDCYKNVLVIDESSLSEPDAHQFKYWAKGAGNVRVGWAGEGEKTQEVLELISMKQLDEEGLAEVRAGARALEKGAYERSKDVYGETPPLQQRGGEK